MYLLSIQTISLFLFLIKFCSSNSINYFGPHNDSIHKGQVLGKLNFEFTDNQAVGLDKYEEYFKIDKTGKVSAKQDIDRDEFCKILKCCQQLKCQLKTFAYYVRGGSSKNFDIIMTIKDQNDNKPYFPNPKNWLNISENAALYSRYPLPIAKDDDSKFYGIDRYEITDGLGTFKLTMQNKEPYLELIKGLDREQINHYNIILTVYDKGDKKTSLKIKINIADVNDNVPYFTDHNPSLKTINRSIGEDYMVQKTLYEFKAKDNDTGINSKIQYSISKVYSEPTDVIYKKFRLASDRSGKIMLREQLDYENPSERLIKLVIIASDHGLPRKSTSASLYITVLDINDNKPLIESQNIIPIRENVSSEKLLMIVRVTDADSVSENKVTCELMHKSRDKFKLQKLSRNSNKYHLTNLKSFDYEFNHYVTVSIHCVDHASPSKQTIRDFRIQIIDENDNKPIWQKPIYKFNVTENSNISTLIGRVIAIDKDSKKFNKVTYLVSDKTPLNYRYYVKLNNATGSLRISQVINRENISNLFLEIIACDNYDYYLQFGNLSKCNCNSVNVTIKVNDVNDEVPKFIGKTRLFKIPEDTTIGTIITDLKFIDNDSYENNGIKLTLSYFDYSDTTNWFRLDQNRIIVNRKLDREKCSNISVIVKAVDNGTRPLSSTVKITVELLDVNDNPPLLRSPNNDTLLPIIFQNSQPNTYIDSLKAIDKDFGYNGSIKYHLKRTNFSKDSLISLKDDGKIHTNWDNYNAPDNGLYFIWVIISDQGRPPLEIQTRFFLNVTNYQTKNDAFMSNIVILILIIVCSLALIVSLIAAIFWVRFRVSTDTIHDNNMHGQHRGMTPIDSHPLRGIDDEFYERELLTKDLAHNQIVNHQYSMMNLDKQATILDGYELVNNCDMYLTTGGYNQSVNGEQPLIMASPNATLNKQQVHSKSGIPTNYIIQQPSESHLSPPPPYSIYESSMNNTIQLYNANDSSMNDPINMNRVIHNINSDTIGTIPSISRHHNNGVVLATTPIPTPTIQVRHHQRLLNMASPNNSSTLYNPSLIGSSSSTSHAITPLFVQHQAQQQQEPNYSDSGKGGSVEDLKYQAHASLNLPQSNQSMDHSSSTLFAASNIDSNPNYANSGINNHNKYITTHLTTFSNPSNQGGSMC